MSPRFYKHAAMVLAGALGAVLILCGAATLEPHMGGDGTMRGIPDQWASHTWDNGERQAAYDTRGNDCDIAIDKAGLDGNGAVVDLTLVCGSETPTVTGRSGGDLDEPHTFATESADFGMGMAGWDYCDVSFEYGSEEGAEDLIAFIWCMR